MKKIVLESLLFVFCGTLIGVGASIVFAQATTPPQPAQSCEQQLDNAQRVILQLRKQAAQAEFQNVTMQEALMDQQKKQHESQAPVPAKAAEKK